jgi:hypothetical protein
VFLVNSHNPHFSATAERSRSKSFHAPRHTFSRSYGVILPSSLAWVLSRALGFSPRPPESVCGTDTKEAQYAAFLGSLGSPRLPAEAGPHHLSRLNHGLSLSGPRNSPYWLGHGSMHRARPTLLRPRLRQRHPWWCRNINLLSITYAFRPRLRYRLTHGRIILPQETLGLRRPGFSPGLSLLMPA